MGTKLLQNPALISDMIHSAKVASGLPVSIKIRIMKDLSQTIEVAKRAEAMGCSFLTVHGRRPDQKSTEQANLEAIKLVKENVSIPVVANGTIWTDKDSVEVKKQTNVDGVMSARGLLRNPALFAGFETLPVDCLRDWLETSVKLGSQWYFTHCHLMFMLFDIHSRAEKSEFNSLTNVSSVIEWLKENGPWKEEHIKNEIINSKREILKKE
jgi:tRNA-dihydrouridine synthase 4